MQQTPVTQVDVNTNTIQSLPRRPLLIALSLVLSKWSFNDNRQTLASILGFLWIISTKKIGTSTSPTIVKHLVIKQFCLHDSVTALCAVVGKLIKTIPFYSILMIVAQTSLFVFLFYAFVCFFVICFLVFFLFFSFGLFVVILLFCDKHYVSHRLYTKLINATSHCRHHEKSRRGHLFHPFLTFHISNPVISLFIILADLKRREKQHFIIYF